jgi:hypothetical protein
LFRPLEQLLKPLAPAHAAPALPFGPKGPGAGKSKAGQDQVTPEQSH